MLQPTLTRRVEDSLRALNGAAPLIGVLEALNAAYQKIDTCLLGIAEGGGNQIYDNSSAAHSQLASLSSVTKKFSARSLFREVERLEQQLSATLGEGLDEPKFVTNFLEKLDAFAESYSVYVAHQAGTNALPLLLIARHLLQALENLRGFLEYLSANWSGQMKPQTDEAELSLVLTNISNLEDFAEKLLALYALYAELCYVLGVSAASHPLRIGKIESGSLWTRLFGDTKVIGLMVELVEGAVRFLHRNYTTEGKFSAIPKKIEALDSILDFSNRLKESGADVSSLQESLAKNAVSIANSLNTLISSQPVVEVNGKVLSIGQEAQKAHLEQALTKKITYEVPDTNQPDEE